MSRLLKHRAASLVRNGSNPRKNYLIVDSREAKEKNMENLTLKLPVSAKKIAFILLGFVIFLVIASLIGQYYKDAYAENELITKIIGKFDLDYERNNVPTWYQSITLGLSAFLLAFIALVRYAGKDRDAGYWGVLSGIFLYLSLDEAVSIHEQMTMPLRTNFDLGGLFYLSWVIPAAFLMIIFFLCFLKFLIRMPPQMRFLMVTAGMIYVLGALGIEMVGGNYLHAMDDLPTRVTDFRYVLITTFEEFLEMLGIIIFNYSLLVYLFEPEAVFAIAEGSPGKERRREGIRWNILDIAK